MQKFIHHLHTKVEHRLRHLGLYGGVSLALVAIAVWYIDATFIKPDMILSVEQSATLMALNNTLSSVIVAILLTTFSVVFVVMQLASSQFSPRILRHFLYSDIRIQQFIGWFLGALACIFIPQVLHVLFQTGYLQLSVLLALIMSGYSVLVSFPGIISHLSDNMNVSALTHRIKQEVMAEVNTAYQAVWKTGDALKYHRSYRDKNLDSVRLVWKGNSGYLSQVNYDTLEAFAQKHFSDKAACFYQKPIVGEFIMTEVTAVLDISFETAVSEEQKQRIMLHWQKVAGTIFVVNKYRSYTQDINFGVRKLVDIAIKAISPAVNDPTTCINCIDYLGEIVRSLAVRRFPSSRALALREKGIFVNEFDFDELVDFCFGQIAQWGKNDPVVMKRIVGAIKNILPCVQNPYHLSVLIKEVQDIELERIYSASNVDRHFTQEQQQTIHRELASFKRKAIAQITKCRPQFVTAQGCDGCIEWLETYAAD